MGLLLSHWLLSFGAKFESSSVIGSQFWRQNNFQTRTRIGPWKMAKKKGGKMIFKPGPPLALGKLVFHSFSARKNHLSGARGAAILDCSFTWTQTEPRWVSANLVSHGGYGQMTSCLKIVFLSDNQETFHTVNNC